MKLANYIWKARLGLAAATGALSLLLLLMPGPASASQEAYKWTNAGAFDAITASGGNYTGNVQFNRTGTDKTGATYTATAHFSCNGTDQTATFTIGIAGGPYNNGKPSIPTTADLDTGGACPALTWDTPIAIDDTAGSTAAATSTPASAAAPTSTCDQGSLGWLFCPVIDNLSSTVTNLATSALEPLLKVKEISPTSTPGIYQVWQRLRDLADVFLILIFLLIIYGTATQQDIPWFSQYTIRKIWLRIIVGVIFIQFSFAICQALVDIGNVGGAGITALLQTLTHASKGPGSDTNAISNLIVNGGLIAGLGAGAAGAAALGFLTSWTIAIPMLLSFLLSILAVFLTLGARYLLLAVLVAISPLALALWILPNTERYAKDWFETLFRLILMYPIVIGILSLGGMLNEIIPQGPTDSASAAVLAHLVKPLIVVAAFLAVPLSFRLAGRALHRIYGVLGDVTSRGQGWLKDSDMYQRALHQRKANQATQMSRVLQSNTLTSLQRKGGAGKLGAGLLGFGAAMALQGAPRSQQTLQRSHSELVNKAKKELDELKEGKNPEYLQAALAAAAGDDNQRRRLRQEAPDMLRYASTASGREAIYTKLLDMGFADSKDLGQFINARPKSGLARLGTSGNVASEFASLRDAAQYKRFEEPGLVLRHRDAQRRVEVKDAAGNVLGTDYTVRAGAIDKTSAIDAFARLNAGDMGKLSADNWRAMTEVNATGHLTQDAQDLGFSIAYGLDMHSLHSALDPNSRTRMPLLKKIELVKAISANRHQFAVTKITRDKYDVMLDNFNKDQELASLILKEHGRTDTDLDGMSEAELAKQAIAALGGRFQPEAPEPTAKESTSDYPDPRGYR